MGGCKKEERTETNEKKRGFLIRGMLQTVLLARIQFAVFANFTFGLIFEVIYLL